MKEIGPIAEIDHEIIMKEIDHTVGIDRKITMKRDSMSWFCPLSIGQ